MKKKGGFLGGLIVFFFIIIILGGVGFLGYNIIFQKGAMPGMSMASNSSSGNANSTDTYNTGTGSDSTSNTDTANTSSNGSAVNDASSTNNNNAVNSTNSGKISQINQVMVNKDTLDNAVNTINSSLQQMTLDPYAAKTDTNASKNNQNDSNQNNSSAQGSTTVNIYTAQNSQAVQMPSMGTTYDPDKMQQLHSGLYKVSVGMQLLNQLQSNIQSQIEQSGIDTSIDSKYFLNQYYTTIQNKNKLNEALTYINEAVDLININPYVDANGVVYDSSRMTQLHDSIYKIAQGVVDLNKLNDDLLNQAVQIGNLAQNAYNQELANSANNTNTMNMATSNGLFGSLSTSTIITFVLIAFVIIFIIGLLGSIANLFKSGKKDGEQIIQQ